MKTAGELLVEKGKGMISVTPDTTIHEAIKTMVVNKIGAVLIKDGDEIIGIYTERDLLNNTATTDFDPRIELIKDFMTTKLHSCEYTCDLYQMKDKFLGIRVRHMLIKKDDKYIGLLSYGDVARAGLNERTEELKKLNEMVSWEYYENWKWKKK
ncbi:MAG: CBS domain-containing protein [Calditrichia bacterium]|nr:CBS domain-containing protein [Calditrichia bacterium]